MKKIDVFELFFLKTFNKAFVNYISAHFIYIYTLNKKATVLKLLKIVLKGSDYCLIVQLQMGNHCGGGCNLMTIEKKFPNILIELLVKASSRRLDRHPKLIENHHHMSVCGVSNNQFC